jgi:hypothetical protein
MPVAKIRFPLNTVRSVLRLPRETKITGVALSPNGAYVVLTVDHADIPAGDPTRVIKPEFTPANFMGWEEGA